MHSYVQSCSFQLPMWMVLEAGSIDDAELSSEFGHFSVQLLSAEFKSEASFRRPSTLNDPSKRAFRCNTPQTALAASHLKLGSRRLRVQNSRHTTPSSP